MVEMWFHIVSFVVGGCVCGALADWQCQCSVFLFSCWTRWSGQPFCTMIDQSGSSQSTFENTWELYSQQSVQTLDRLVNLGDGRLLELVYW
jgi:hypothetical protein